jgi:NAD(P)-dependent dehydrogenase (short-subunit alcohol dehydrogenase family)
VLVNNAGLFMDRRAVNADGIETTLAVNHYAGFLLTGLLFERLAGRAPARVITVSSMGHRFARRIDPERLEPSGRFSGWRLYCMSKLCNVLFTRELARRGAARGVAAYCVHPLVATRFGYNTRGLLGARGLQRRRAPCRCCGARPRRGGDRCTSCRGRSRGRKDY